MYYGFSHTINVVGHANCFNQSIAQKGSVHYSLRGVGGVCGCGVGGVGV